MAALSGLISHLESSQNISIYKGKLKISLIHLKDFLVLDFYSIKNLELTLNLQGQRKNSLASFFECKTQAGTRLLRATLVQPVKDKDVIRIRQESVKELIDHSAARAELKQCLQNFPNTELVTSRLLNKPKTLTEKFMKTQITNVIHIYKTLNSAKALLELIVRYDLKTQGLRVLRDLIDDRRIDQLHLEIEKFLSDEVLDAKSKNVSFFDCINCVRDGVNALLDVNRQVFCNFLEEVKKLESQFKYKLGDPGLSVVYSATRGYYFQFSSEVIKPNYQALIGENFFKITHKGKKSQATTASLMSLNEKIKNSQSSIVSLNYSIIEELCDRAREYLLSLYNISHAVACIDLYLSFSTFSISFDCTKPDFNSTSLSLQKMRNPLLLCTTQSSVSITFCNFKRFYLLKSQNSSGKTTFLKTLALNSLLAHTGCFIPAESCTLTNFDYILTMLGERNSIEQKSSSFMSEMKDASYILDMMNHKTLILIDELGRGTSQADGSSIAWAICEKIYEANAFCVFSTNFEALLHMEECYLALRNVYLDGFQIVEGMEIQSGGHGISLAFKSGVPGRVVDRAQEIFKEITGNREKRIVDFLFYKKKEIAFLMKEKLKECRNLEEFKTEYFKIVKENSYK
jgi:DNA mismatch repair protein MSH4